ncbi:DUF397 domain-containing protein [Streptomyces rectiverticillatus]|nr:DUF397 domain-containing protein [Streptomyces rectiverticillatus]
MAEVLVLRGGLHCLCLAAPGSAVLLRESETPDVVLATTRAALRPLITRIKTGTPSAS